MSCSPIHLKDYVYRELADSERRKLEVHLKTCPACREELDRLRLTEAALFSLRDEEIPQRIAFVSDPVFEPSPWKRWWTGVWNSPARLGFASAAMLSAAILFAAITRPAPVTIQPAPAAAVRLSESPAAPSDAQIQQRVDAAVNRAVNASQQQELVRVNQLMSQLEQASKDMKLQAAQLDWMQRHADNARFYASDYGPPVRPALGGQQ
jgi:anti-sigma factor RsiW